MSKFLEEDFKKIQLQNAMLLQKKIMNLIDEYHESLYSENEVINDDENDENDYDEDDDSENNPIQTELYLLMDVYRTIIKE